MSLRSVLLVVQVILAFGLLSSACTQSVAPPVSPKPAETTKPTPTAAQLASTQTAPTNVPTTGQPTTAPSKSSFPERGKSISIIVAYAAGGGTDVTARIVAPLLERELGVPVNVVNKEGAGGQVGYTELAHAKPDGYTIGYLILPTVITTYLDPERKAAFNAESFQLLGLQDNDAGIIAVQASSAYKNLQDLVAAARAKPDSVKIAASGGVMSDDHLAAIKLVQASGAKFAIVYFNGSAPGRTALLGGHVDVYFGNVSELTSDVKAGQVRLLAVMDEKRSPAYPDVPTAVEQGFKVISGVHRGIGMPAGAPKEVVDRLAGAIKKAFDSPEFKTKMEELKYVPLYMDPVQYRSFWQQYEKEMVPLIEMAKKQSE